LYEDLQKPDEAKTQYQYVGAKMPEAINNLARLNILKKDYATAVSLLQFPLTGEQFLSLQPAIQFTLLKNLAWARLEQGKWADAETHLTEAIDLAKTAQLEPAQTVAAHCLKAQVIEAQGNPKTPLPAQKQALPEWKTCLRYANVTVPEEDGWRTIAEKRVETLEGK
jgi:Flp pilus assembly protein TadD